MGSLLRYDDSNSVTQSHHGHQQQGFPKNRRRWRGIPLARDRNRLRHLDLCVAEGKRAIARSRSFRLSRAPCPGRHRIPPLQPIGRHESTDSPRHSSLRRRRAADGRHTDSRRRARRIHRHPRCDSGSEIAQVSPPTRLGGVDLSHYWHKMRDVTTAQIVLCRARSICRPNTGMTLAQAIDATEAPPARLARTECTQNDLATRRHRASGRPHCGAGIVRCSHHFQTGPSSGCSITPRHSNPSFRRIVVDGPSAGSV